MKTKRYGSRGQAQEWQASAFLRRQESRRSLFLLLLYFSCQLQLPGQQFGVTLQQRQMQWDRSPRRVVQVAGTAGPWAALATCLGSRLRDMACAAPPRSEGPQ